MKGERFLLDTSVISMFAPTNPPMNPGAARWFAANADRLYISTVTIAEIEKGIRKLARGGGAERARKYGVWLDGLISHFNERLPPIDVEISLVAGALADDADAVGRNPGFADVLIAATARSLDAAVLTRNLSHFEPLAVRCADPFAADFLR